MDNEQSKKAQLPSDSVKEWFNFHPFFQERPFRNLLNSIDEFFHQSYLKPSFKVNVEEEEDKYIVRAELSGVQKNHIKIQTMPNRLTITVNRFEIETLEDEQTETFQKNQSIQQVSRTIPFYHPIVDGKTKATYRDGLLKIILPKQREKNINLE